jgi:hypothetical protein
MSTGPAVAHLLGTLEVKLEYVVDMSSPLMSLEGCAAWVLSVAMCTTSIPPIARVLVRKVATVG